MASQKISAYYRDEIVRNVMAHKFASERIQIEDMKAKLETLKDKRNDLGYELVYSEKARKQIQSLPKEWLPESNRVRVMVEDQGVKEVRFGNMRPVPYEDFSGGYSHVTSIVSPESEYFKAEALVEEAKEALRDFRREVGQQEREASSKVLAVVNSVTTTGKLIEVWPEVQQFMPEMAYSSSGGVPAEVIGSLNEYLNL